MLIDCACKSWRVWYLKLQLKFDKNKSDCFFLFEVLSKILLEDEL